MKAFPYDFLGCDPADPKCQAERYPEIDAASREKVYRIEHQGDLRSDETAKKPNNGRSPR
tara:strand:- start:233 stop:412 length:180 start_codon:yes stop_codon:yes gene_type:complete